MAIHKILDTTEKSKNPLSEKFKSLKISKDIGTLPTF